MKYEMEMPDINLAHADLNKYNQAPNHLVHHLQRDFVFRGKVTIYIYIYIWHFKKTPTQSLSTKDRKYYIFSF